MATDTTRDEAIARVVESATRLGVELDEREAEEWVAAMETEATGGDLVVDVDTGVYGHRVTMLDFQPEDLARFRAMAPIEPIRFIPHAPPTTLLLQHGRIDNLVPMADAQALHTAVPQPTIRWYEAGHGLDQQAVWDRHDWLQVQIGLDARQ